MKTIKLTGKVLLSVTQYITMPDDEVEEFLADSDNYDVNIDLDDCYREVYDWEYINAEVV